MTFIAALNSRARPSIKRYSPTPSGRSGRSTTRVVPRVGQGSRRLPRPARELALRLRAFNGDTAPGRVGDRGSGASDVGCLMIVIGDRSELVLHAPEGGRS
jgi:hypothetical protein